MPHSMGHGELLQSMITAHGSPPAPSMGLGELYTSLSDAIAAAAAGGGVITATDFDACTDTGLYWIPASATNGPPSTFTAAYDGNDGILHVMAESPLSIVQRWYDIVQENTWARSNNSGWSDWMLISGEPESNYVDFNLLPQAGTFSLPGNSTNGPGPSAYGMCLVLGSYYPAALGYDATQLWISSRLDPPQMWFRGRSNSQTWSGWLQVAPAPPQPTSGVSTAAQTLAATADINTYASLPTPLVRTIIIPSNEPTWNTLLTLSAYINIGANNVETALALDFSGALSSPAGSKPEDRLHVLAKSPIAATISVQHSIALPPGTTTVEIKYASTGAASVSDIAYDLVPISPL